MNDTPRTDAASVDAGYIIASHSEDNYVPTEFARTLERELAEVGQLAEGRLTQWKKEEANHALDLKQLYAVTQERDKLKDELAVAKEFRAKAEELEQRIRGEANKLRGQLAEANRLWKESCDNNEFLRREADSLRAQLESANHDAAAMRDAIEFVIDDMESGTLYQDYDKTSAQLGKLRAALSSPAGKDYVRRDVLEKCVEALELAKNTVECASIETRPFPYQTGMELPWHVATNNALAAARAELERTKQG